MTRISPAHLVQAIRDLNGMGVSQREKLADEIFVYQPTLLSSILVLDRMGVDAGNIDIALHALLVSWLAMKACGAAWPQITEAMQASSLQRLTGQMRFTEGLSARQRDQALQTYIEDHPERYLLAFVHTHLNDSGVLGIETDAQRHVVMATLNLVECIGHAAPRAPT